MTNKSKSGLLKVLSSINKYIAKKGKAKPNLVGVGHGRRVAILPWLANMIPPELQSTIRNMPIISIELAEDISKASKMPIEFFSIQV